MQRLSRRFSGNLFLYAVIVQIVFGALNSFAALIYSGRYYNSTLFVLFFRLLIYLPPIIIIAARKYPFSRIVRLNTFPGRQMLFITGISICLYLFVSLFGRIFENLLYSFIDPGLTLSFFSGTDFSLWPAIFTSCLIPAILYELMFRGIVQSGYSDIAPLKACLIVGILYGLMYSGKTDFITYAFFGFVLSYISIKTNSMIPSMIASFFYQLLKLINLKYLIYRYILSSLGVQENIVAFILVIISIIIGGILLKSMPDTSKSAKPLGLPSPRRIIQALRDFRHKLQLSYFPDDAERNSAKNEDIKYTADESLETVLPEEEVFPDDSPKQHNNNGFIIGGTLLAVITLLSFISLVINLVQTFIH